MKRQTSANQTSPMEKRDRTKTRGSDRRTAGPTLRVALAVVFACKLGLVALWYTGALSAAFAFAAEGAGMRGAAGATTDAPKAGDGSVKGGSGKASGSAGDEAPAGSSDEAVTTKPPEARAMVEAITRRQVELDAREREMVARAEHLKIYEQDVTAKIASLEEIEKRLQGRAKAASAAIDAAAESLAKVYGAMKPADAAPILERLDEATVLTIFGRMKEKQIGEILPLMSREKAIALTQALAASASR